MLWRSYDASATPVGQAIRMAQLSVEIQGQVRAVSPHWIGVSGEGVNNAKDAIRYVLTANLASILFSKSVIAVLSRLCLSSNLVFSTFLLP